jgi:ribulose-5-phosphate 4-epimerase/fuculose-1-phosphate aldolase
MSNRSGTKMKLTADEGMEAPGHTTATEAELRQDLAAAYRLTHMLGMDYMIYNHITVRVPGPEKHFLINPFGLSYDEITASNLLKIDLEGNIVEGPSSQSVNYAGFIIHGAIHDRVPDLHCVMHTHVEAGMAIAAMETKLLPINQDALIFYDRVGYHDFEGIVSTEDERERMLAAMGDRPVLVLRNHGLLTAAPTIAGAFVLMVFLDRACRAQLSLLQSGQKIVLPPDDICRHTASQYWKGAIPPASFGQQAFAALKRRLDRQTVDYKN